MSENKEENTGKMQRSNIQLPKEVGKTGALIIVVLIVVIAYLLGERATMFGSQPYVGQPGYRPAADMEPGAGVVADVFAKQYLPSGSEALRGDGPIYLIEYSDFECPFCQRFHSVVQELVDAGEVTWVYRHLPLPNHRTAKFAAVVSECVKNRAGDEAFWNYTDAVFNTTQGLGEELYVSLAKEQGLTDGQVRDCVEPGSKEFARVERTMAQANELSIRGTPRSFVINKKTGAFRSVDGARDVNYVRTLIEEIR